MTSGPTPKPRVVAMIPVRLESSRLSRKALADICGLPMIAHVLLRTGLAGSLDAVYVATDSAEIKAVVERLGHKAILTGKQHETGTDRIAEAAATIEADIIVNVQGDEALLDPAHIDLVVKGLVSRPDCSCAVLVTPFKERGANAVIKAVLNERSEILYASRADIPSDARTANPPLTKVCHIVPFRKAFLLEYAKWPKGTLENIEYNEYLRILEKGHKILAVPVSHASVSVDTPEDLKRVSVAMISDPLFQRYAPA